jgi:CHAT domain-containing protein
MGEISNNYALFPYFAALGRLHMLTGTATLSGCETGVANQGLADTESLVRVFLRAGVPNVVASK